MPRAAAHALCLAGAVVSASFVLAVATGPPKVSPGCRAGGAADKEGCPSVDGLARDNALLQLATRRPQKNVQHDIAESGKLTQISSSGSGYHLRITPWARPDLMDLFPTEDQGFQGGDSGASVKLDDSTYIWLWGDTLVGRNMPGGLRAIEKMPRQSVAVMDMKTRQPKYTLPARVKEMFDPQFHPINEGYPVYWLVEGIVTKTFNRLLLQVWNIYGGLNGHGLTMLVVDNPADDPNSWRFREGKIPHANESCAYTHGMTQVGDLIYILGRCGDYAVMARGKEVDVTGMNLGTLKFWDGHEWTWDSSRQAPLFHAHWASEGSLKFHEGTKLWYVPLLQAVSRELTLATASDLTGPWTTQHAWQIPDEWSAPSNRTSYAAKAHPELTERGDTIMISYCTNVAMNNGNWFRYGDKNHGLANRTAYRLQFVEMQLTKDSSAAMVQQPVPQMHLEPQGSLGQGDREGKALPRSELWRLSGGGGASGDREGKALPRSELWRLSGGGGASGLPGPAGPGEKVETVQKM